MSAALSSMRFVARTSTLPSLPLLTRTSAMSRVSVTCRTQLLGPIWSLILVTGLRHRTLIIKTLRPLPQNAATDKSLERP